MGETSDDQLAEYKVYRLVEGWEPKDTKCRQKQCTANLTVHSRTTADFSGVQVSSIKFPTVHGTEPRVHLY